MIDTHCHIFNNYYENIDEVINNMGNNKMIISGTNKEDNLEILKLCEKYPNVYGTIGFHPTEINDITEKDLEFIEQNINNPKIVGIGEIGLDYYHDKDSKERQKLFFIKQIELAKKYKKAIVVHSRDAINDTYQVLKKEAHGLKIDIHCFSGSMEMAQNFIEIGCLLGIGGVLTFKNNKNLKEVIKNINLDKILLETDSPFLTPEPYRGKQNQPSYTIFIAQEIAKIKNMSVEDVLKITTNNAISQFDLPDDL